MLLRLRVRLPDRPGSLGQLARTLGVTGADIVQMVVLERIGGRALDDFTLVWPATAPIDRIMAGLAAIPGVVVEGVWRSVGAPAVGGADAELVGQVAANPDEGLATLVDTVPALLCADWAAALVVPADWAEGNGTGVAGVSNGASADADSAPTVAHASWRAPQPLRPPDVTPLRPRAFEGPDATRFAAAPFGRAGLVLLVARGGGPGVPQAPAFHVTEVDRLAQVVRASALVLGTRLDEVSQPRETVPGGGSRRGGWPVNAGVRLAALDT